MASSRTPTPSVDPAPPPLPDATGPTPDPASQNPPPTPYRSIAAADDGGLPATDSVEPVGPPPAWVHRSRRNIITVAVDAPMWRRADMRHALAHHDLRTVCHIMRRHGISQRVIAAATGLAQSDVSDYAGGKRHAISYDVLERFALGLHLPRGWLGLAYDDETLTLLRPTTGFAATDQSPDVPQPWTAGGAGTDL